MSVFNKPSSWFLFKCEKHTCETWSSPAFEPFNLVFSYRREPPRLAPNCFLCLKMGILLSAVWGMIKHFSLTWRLTRARKFLSFLPFNSYDFGQIVRSMLMVNLFLKQVAIIKVYRKKCFETIQSLISCLACSFLVTKKTTEKWYWNPIVLFQLRLGRRSLSNLRGIG